MVGMEKSEKRSKLIVAIKTMRVIYKLKIAESAKFEDLPFNYIPCFYTSGQS